MILQQLKYKIKHTDDGVVLPPEEIWTTIGKVFVGPQIEAQNINEREQGETSTPQVNIASDHTHVHSVANASFIS